MKNDNISLARDLKQATKAFPFWKEYLAALQADVQASYTLHLAVFIEPYLQFVLNGQKTVESRFSTRRYAPYNQVRSGDVILLKQSSGPIIGICQVAHVWCYHLNPQSWQYIQEQFAQALCAQDPAFWKDREHASFATLMQIQNVQVIAPIPYKKRDRRGWVVLQPSVEQSKLEL